MYSFVDYYAKSNFRGNCVTLIFISQKKIITNNLILHCDLSCQLKGIDLDALDSID